MSESDYEFTYELDEVRLVREAREHHRVFSKELLEATHKYDFASTARDVKVNDEYFSARWILFYAFARHSGIACLITSASYASRTLYYSNPGKYSPLEQHRVASRKEDYQLLWQAHMLLHAHKKKNKKQTVNA